MPAYSACRKEIRMEDILYLGLALAFFAASIGLVHLFERLRKRS